MSGEDAVGAIRSGNALARQGRLAEAEAAYRLVLARTPGQADARYNLGVVLRDQKRHAEAESAFRAAVALRPDHAESHNNLGMALMAQARAGEALACFECAVALKPGHARAHNNRGAALLELGRTDHAVEAFRRALAVKADFAKAHNNLGVAFQYQGRMAEAAAAFERAVAADATYAEALFNLAGQLGADNPSAPAISERLERSAATETDPAARATALFALGRLLDQQGALDRAFDAFAEANALKRAALSFDIAAAEARMAAIAEQFPAALFRRLEGAGAPSRRPVFILGMPRSGTTLVEQILAAHPHAQGAGELRNLGDLAAAPRSGGAFPAWATDLTAADCHGFGEAYLAGLPPAGADQSRITDKAIANFQYLGLIQLCLPGATIIHCRRDPRDVGLSCFFTRFTEGQDFAYDLVEFARYWRAYDRLMDHWRAVLGPGRMLEVPYKALVTDFEPWARRLVAHCGLDWDDACLRFYEFGREVRTASLAQVRRPIYASAVERWRRYEHRLGPLLAALEHDGAGWNQSNR